MPGGAYRSRLDGMNGRGVMNAFSPGNITGNPDGQQLMFNSHLGDDRNNKTGAPVNFVMQPDEDDE